MSVIKVTKALHTAINAMSPALSTAWPNVPFTPVDNVPFQRVDILFAQPNNQEYGPNYQEIGFMQVTLFYPHKVGLLDAMNRAELLRTTFRRGTSFINDSLAVVIERTPEIKPSQNDGERFVIPVIIRFYANAY